MSPADGPPPVGLDRTANLLGALAQTIADRCADEMAAAGGRSPSSSAALSALLHFLDSPSVDRLRQVLGLTPSGTVRLLDRLAADGYIERGPGADGRSVTITLTASGRDVAERVAAARAAVLTEALGGLPPAQREALDDIAGTILTRLMQPLGSVRWMCRLCDTGVCRGGPGGCPVTNEAVRRYLPAGASEASGGAAGGAGPATGPAGGAAPPRR
jgi:DNA-binding MarR family transcriptional regulator